MYISNTFILIIVLLVEADILVAFLKDLVFMRKLRVTFAKINGTLSLQCISPFSSHLLNLFYSLTGAFMSKMVFHEYEEMVFFDKNALPSEVRMSFFVFLPRKP